MTGTLHRIQELAVGGSIRISDHGYDELAADGILVRDILASIRAARLVEDYPHYVKGPCVLVLQQDPDGRPVHVVWGIPVGKSGPAVLVTAYRPDPDLWENGFLRRRK